MKIVIVAALLVAVVAAGCGNRVEKPTSAVTPTSISGQQTPAQLPMGPSQPTPKPTAIASSTVPSGHLSFSCTGGTGTMLFDILFPSGTEYHEKGVADPVIGIRVIGCFTDPIGVSSQTQALGVKLASALFSKPNGYRSDEEFYSVAIAILGSFLKDYTAPSATLVVNGDATGQTLQVAPLYRQPTGKTGPTA